MDSVEGELKDCEGSISTEAVLERCNPPEGKGFPEIRIERSTIPFSEALFFLLL